MSTRVPSLGFCPSAHLPLLIAITRSIIQRSSVCTPYTPDFATDPSSKPRSRPLQSTSPCPTLLPINGLLTNLSHSKFEPGARIQSYPKCDLPDELHVERRSRMSVCMYRMRCCIGCSSRQKEVHRSYSVFYQKWRT